MASLTPAKNLFDLLVSKDFDPEILDSSGKSALDPAKAEIFSFDFRAESGKDYGTVVIMLSDDNEFDVYCTDNVGKTMEGSDKDEWFAFLEQLKNFAVRNNFMDFGIKNLNHLRYSMQGQAAIKEGLFESWQGKRDVSWNGNPTEARLMIKHKRALGEDEARFRYVESLFIETAENERFKLGFKNLTAGKAMLEHVRQGGKPYDARGQHITNMVMELSVLSRFRRANHGQLLEGDTAQLVEQTNVYYENLQRSLKSLTGARGYKSYFESWNPTEITEQQVVIEGLKHLFVTQTIDPRIEDALPLLAKIQQQETAMKESNIFEAWANNLMEGTWQLPDTPEKRNQLIELMQQDLPVGADATNATEQLYNLLGDDHLFDQLEALADRDANADARQIIYDRLQELSNHPDVREVIDNLQVDNKYEMNPPEATPADLDTPEEVDEDGQPVLPPTQPRKKWSMDPTPDQMPQGERQRPNYFEELKDTHTQTEDPAGTHELAYPEYASDLSTILKHAGLNPQENPAPDYEEEIAEDELDDVETIGGDKTDAFIDDTSIKQDQQDLEEEGWGLNPTPSAMEDEEKETDEGQIGALAGGVAGELVAPELTPISGMIGAAIGDKLGDMGSPDKETNEGENDGPKFNGQIGAGASQGPIFRTDATTGQHVDVSKVVPGKWGSVGNPGYSTKPGTPTFKDMGTAVPANPTALPKPAGGGSSGSAMDLPKGMLGGPNTPVNEKESPLAGQYGHSGKMKPVAKDLSFLDRLKELSGLRK